MRTIFILFIALSALLLLTPQVYKIESFSATAMPQQVVPSSVDLFKLAKNYQEFDKLMKEKKNTLADRNDLMTFHRCYQIDHRELPIQEFCKSAEYYLNIAVTCLKLHTASFGEVQNRIIQEIIKFKDTLPMQKIEDDVVVFISQAPYFVDNQNRTMTVQYHINQYIFKPYNITEAQTIEEPLDIFVMIYYTGYTKNKSRAKSASAGDLLKILAPFESRDQKCNIECTHENKLICGCANKGKHGGDPKKTAICLGVNPERPQEETRYNFLTAYKINKLFDPFVLAKVF